MTKPSVRKVAELREADGIGMPGEFVVKLFTTDMYMISPKWFDDNYIRVGMALD